MLSNLAASDIHVSLRAEPLFELGPLTVTNSMLYGTLCSLVIMALLVFAAFKIKIKPTKGFAQLFEIITEYIVGLLEGPFGSRAKAVKYLPIFGTFFFFVFFSNILALLPVVGPGLFWASEGANTPLFRPFTADLNGTIAMSVIAIVIVQYLSIKEQGVKGHLKHYFTDKPMNPLNLFIGALEVLGELTRILSLSLRLFLNTAVGEILVSVFTSLVITNGRTPLAVIPIILFEILVAGIQAYVYCVLTATYLGLAISHHDDHSDAHSPAPKQVEGAKSA